jgi:hypothetical protein
MQLRDLVHMFISRVELLPEDETTAEHDEAKRIEAQLIEVDRTTRTDGEPGLFKGAFCKTRLQYHGPIRDDEDGVLRCPRCAWEMEDGECGQCGYEDDEGDFSDDEDHEDDTVGSRSVISIPSSAMDADDVASHPRFVNPFIFEQSRTTNDDFREWIRRDEEGRRARRAARQIERLNRQERASTADTEATTSTMMDRHHDHEAYGVDSENEEEMAAFLERHPYNNGGWNTDTAETEDEDEDMTSAIDDEDGESTTSFHRAAIIARDQGMHPPFESDLSTNGSEVGGDAETATEGNSSDDSTESENDSNTPEPTPAVHGLARRPARVVIDSDDDSSRDSSSSDEEEETHGQNDDDDEEESDDSSGGDSTPSPPRPAAVRQARVQMHRNRHAGGRGGGRGRGRPRMSN